jgi:ABC-type methionine transport system ATPase subunit
MRSQTPRAKTSRAQHNRSALARPIFLPPTPPVRSQRAAQVVRWFGLDHALMQRPTTTPPNAPRSSSDDDTLPLTRGTITLLTGPSGGGKSTLLRATQRAPRDPAPRFIDLATIAPPDAPIVDCFPDISLRDALLLLARVGLAEAWTYLRTPGELSDGQRWRLTLAIALHRARRSLAQQPDAPVVLVADEFAALLDRVTACVVARSLRRAVNDDPRLAAVLATTHDDVLRALAPDVVVCCDFGRVTIMQMPTIHQGLSACGFANEAVRKSKHRFDFTGADPRSRKRKTGGSTMRKIVLTSLASVALLTTMAMATALCADTIEVQTRAAPSAPARGSAGVPAGANDRLLTVPPNPCEPPRSLFEFDPRPARRPIMPLYPSVERELDRGNGRIVADTDIDLLRLRLRDDPDGLTESERFALEHDRQLRIDQQDRRAEKSVAHEQLIERESERLAAERERFYRSAGIDAAGASHDTRMLKGLERDYQRDVKQLNRERSAELKRLAKQDLKPDARVAARAEIEKRFDAAQSERRERYSTDRTRIMGPE